MSGLAEKLKVFSAGTMSRAGWSLGERMAGYALNFVAMLLLVRAVPVKAFGEWAFFLTFAGLLELYKSSSLLAAMQHFAAREPGRIDEVVGWARKRSMRALGPIAMACAGIAGVAWLAGRPLVSLYALAYPLLSFCTLAPTLAMGKLQIEGEYRRALWLRVGLSTVSVACVALLYTVEAAAREKVVPLALTLGALGGWVVVKLVTGRVFPGAASAVMDDAPWREYARRTFGTGLLSSLYRSSDLLLLGFCRSPEQVALYSLALRLADLTEIPLQAAGPLVMGRVSHHAAQGRQAWVTRLFVNTTGVLVALCLVGALGFWLLPELLVRLAGGEEYLGSAVVLQVFGIVAVVRPWDRMAGLFLDAVGRPGDNFRKTIVLVVSNIAFDLLVLAVFPGASALPWIAAVSVGALVLSALFGTARLRQLGWLTMTGRGSGGGAARAAVAALLILACGGLLSSCSVDEDPAKDVDILESQKTVRRFPREEPRPKEFDEESTASIPRNWAAWMLEADPRDLVVIALTNHPAIGEAQALTEKNELRADIEEKSWLAPFGLELNASKIFSGAGSGNPVLVEGVAAGKMNLYEQLTYKDRVRLFRHERDVARQHEDVVRGELAWNVRRRLESLRGAMRLLRVRSENLESVNLQKFYADRDFRAGIIPIHEWARVTEIANNAREAYLISMTDVRVFKSDLEEALGVTIEEAYFLRFGQKTGNLELESFGAGKGTAAESGTSAAPSAVSADEEKKP